ncbi:MAG TPA: T9SS type A sorting domain-containing protein [Bacteroidia bacterium]|nr:T9SS type A sorting domain-containing protein [Bacteroidia bacterium]
MKNNFINPVKFGLLFASFMLVCGLASATTYTAVASGNWTSSVTWGGSAPPTNLSSADQVIIGVGMNVTMDQNVTLNNALASINVTGTLSSAAHIKLTVTSGTLTGTGTITAAQLILNATGSLTFTGSMTADTLVNSIISLSSAAQTTVNNELALSGILDITAGGSLKMGANSTIAVSGASLSLSGGTLDLTANYNVEYTNMSTTTGLELSGSGLGKVTINVSGMNNVTLSSNLTTNDSLKFVSGTLILNGNNLTVNGELSGNIMISGNSSSNLTINTSGGVSSSIMFTTGFQNLNNLTINVGSGDSVKVSSDLTIHGNLTLSGGSKLDISGQELMLSSDVTGSGTLVVNSSSKLTFNSSSSITGNINIAGTLGKFTVNIGGSNSVKLGTNLTVDTLDLSSGTLILNSNNLSVNADITASGTGVVYSTAVSNVSVSAATSVNGSLTFDAVWDTVNNLNLNIAGGGSLKLGSQLVINGNLNFTTGYFDIGNNNLSLGVNSSITGAGLMAYVKTSGSGNLTMSANIGDTTRFEVGNSTYLPAQITLNTGSGTGTIGVNVSTGVYSRGTSGVQISSFQPMVNATWLFQNNIGSSLNANMKLSWTTAAEVNGFLHTDDYISHYASLWDDIGDSMTAMASGSLYSVVRANVTSMSPFAVFDQQTIPTGINEVAATDGDIIIYPNPAYQNLYIKNNFTPGSLVNAEIYNTLGQMVSSYQFKDALFAVPVSGLATGTYLIKFYSDNMEVVKKFNKL